MSENNYPPPKATKGDIAHSVVKAGLGAVPHVGSFLAEAFEQVITPPLTKRIQKWREDIGAAVTALETDFSIPLEKLQENDVFIDAVLEASQIAIRTSSQKKHEALRNIVLNAALLTSPDESLQKIFLSFIDTFTDWHLKFMEVLYAPKEYLAKHGRTLSAAMTGSISTLIYDAFPDLKGKDAFCELILSDLYSNKLIGIDKFHGNMTVDGVLTKRTTDIGDLFLNFIKEPAR